MPGRTTPIRSVPKPSPTNVPALLLQVLIRASLISPRAIDQGCERLAGEKALRVGDEYLGHAFVARGMEPADVRQHRDTGRGPKRIRGGQW